MKVTVLKPFVGYDSKGNKHRFAAGDIVDLPDKVDWLKAGLVEKSGPAAKRRSKATSSKAQTRTTR